MASQGSLNKVMLIGNVGDSVKMHYFEGGGCLGRFPLATNESYVNKSTGEQVTNTEWHTIVVRNKAAEVCEKYLQKGSKVYVEGRIKTRKWKDNAGQDRYSTEIQCVDFTFLSSASNNGPSGGSSQTTNSPNKQKNTSSTPEMNPDNSFKNNAGSTHSETQEEDDLPF